MYERYHFLAHPVQANLTARWGVSSGRQSMPVIIFQNRTGDRDAEGVEGIRMSKWALREIPGTLSHSRKNRPIPVYSAITGELFTLFHTGVVLLLALRATACENTALTVSCQEQDVIQIINAHYGRLATASSQCDANIGTLDTECLVSETRDAVVNRSFAHFYCVSVTCTFFSTPEKITLII